MAQPAALTCCVQRKYIIVSAALADLDKVLRPFGDTPAGRGVIPSLMALRQPCMSVQKSKQITTGRSLQGVGAFCLGAKGRAT